MIIRKPIAHLVDADSTARFMRRVLKTETCWLYVTPSSPQTYPLFYAYGEAIVVARFSWVAHYHFDPGQWLVCHSCDERHCVNPDHLWLGTNTDNRRDRTAKKRDRIHSRRRGPIIDPLRESPNYLEILRGLRA